MGIVPVYSSAELPPLLYSDLDGAFRYYKCAIILAQNP